MEFKSIHDQALKASGWVNHSEMPIPQSIDREVNIEFESTHNNCLSPCPKFKSLYSKSGPGPTVK